MNLEPVLKAYVFLYGIKNFRWRRLVIFSSSKFHSGDAWYHTINLSVSNILLIVDLMEAPGTFIPNFSEAFLSPGVSIQLQTLNQKEMESPGTFK
jgi:hypothetical protein